jgi:hypothetical protein
MKHWSKVIAFHFFLTTNIYPHPARQIQSLFAPQYAQSIKSSDLSNGTLIITNPGYYVLTNDIIVTSACSVPTTGFFSSAAIQILSDNVTLDLNTYAISQDLTINTNPYFNLIEVGGFNTIDNSDTTFYTPQQITIKNGGLHGCSGNGIFGHNNTNLHIYDIMISDCNIAGICLESAQSSSIRNCNITGSVNSTGNAYAIFLRDNSMSSPEWTSDGQGSISTNQVLIDHVTIANITTDNTLEPSSIATQTLIIANSLINISQLIAVATAPGVTPSVAMQAQNVITQFNLLSQIIVFSITFPTPTNIASALTQAQATQTQLTILINQIEALTPISGSPDDCVLQAALAQQTTLSVIINLLNQALTIINGIKDYINGSASTLSWNAYGFRAINAHALTVQNCSISNVNSSSSTGHIVGLALDLCQGCSIQNCNVEQIRTTNGQAIGFSCMQQCGNNNFKNCLSTGHVSAAQTIGYYVVMSNCNIFNQCQASARIIQQLLFMRCILPKQRTC